MKLSILSYLAKTRGHFVNASIEAKNNIRMIRFENGDFVGGNLETVFNPITVNEFNFNMFDEQLLKDCYLLYVPNDGSPAQAFNIREREIYFIPRPFEDWSEEYQYFWESEETMLFEDIEELRYFLENYNNSNRMVELLDEIRIKNAIEEYRCVRDVTEHASKELFDAITEVILSKGVERKTIYATLKDILLNQYMAEQEELNEAA